MYTPWSLRDSGVPLINDVNLVLNSSLRDLWVVKCKRQLSRKRPIRLDDRETVICKYKFGYQTETPPEFSK